MVECFNYLIDLLCDFIGTLDGLSVISGFSLLDLLIALIIVSMLIVIMLRRR